jgi:cholesterol oxidase
MRSEFLKPILSLPWQTLKKRYDFVIVGSGYGGSVAAARIAGASVEPRPSVCVLERGMEWPAGAFPDDFSLLIESRLTDDNPLGLFETLRFGPLTVLLASGLGGASLIDAGIGRVPSPEELDEYGWPPSLSYRSLLEYYHRARKTLALATYPGAAQLRKVAALNGRAAQLSTASVPAELAINFTIDGVNAFGATQKPCTGCGDCMTGCNVRAKNTLCMNYLAQARRFGAEIFAQAEVTWVERSAQEWRVHGRYHSADTPEPFVVEAGKVILAAGAVHTTAILMRSSVTGGLTVSPMLGSNLAASLDVFACSYNGREAANAIGFGTRVKAEQPVGPAVAAMLRYFSPEPGVPQMTIYDCSVPSAFGPAGRAMLAMVQGERPEEETEEDTVQARMRILRDIMPASSGGDTALGHTMLLLATGMAEHFGQMVLRRNDASGSWVDIEWDPQPFEAESEVINRELRRHARVLGGHFLPSPFSFAFNNTSLLTLHPAGGCPISETYERGAVDEFGRVFSGDASVHQGLFVMDGALLPPRATEAPLLTICALAERNSERLVRSVAGDPYPQPPKALQLPKFPAALFSPAGLGQYVVESVRGDEMIRRTQSRHPTEELQPLVFVNYRRADASAYAAQVVFRLRADSDEGQIFFDVETAEPGADIGEKIQRALTTSKVLVAIIGREWANRRRLGGKDWVVHEIELALVKGLLIIPVLVDGARMPESDRLPEPITAFAAREALEVRPDHLAEDLAQLQSVVRRACPELGSVKQRTKLAYGVS